MNNIENKVLDKITKISQNKKFKGISYFDVHKIFKDINSAELNNSINTLLNMKKIIVVNKLLFPTNWSPNYSEHENKIIKLLEPFFETGKFININSLKTDIGLINKESLQMILKKLLFEKLIIKINELSYYSHYSFNKKLFLIKDLKIFTISDFKKISGLPSKQSEDFLSFLDKLKITNFDGRSRKINKQILHEYLII